MLHPICQQNWKTQQRPQDWKRSVFIPIPKKGNAKECSNYCTIALISHASKVMFKILQAILQQYVNRELPDVQAGFRKGRGTRDQIANIRWIIEKVREFHKNIYFCFIEGERWQLAPAFLPGKSHGRRSLVGCSPRGHEESDMTEQLHFHSSLSCIGEGNGNPLQCSCLENPRDGGAW